MLIEVTTSEAVVRTTVAQVELDEIDVREAIEGYGGDFGKYIISCIANWEDYARVDYQPLVLPLGIDYEIEFDILETP